MKAVSSKLLSSIAGIDHAFGTRAEPVAPSMLAVWEKHKPVWKQVHQAGIAHVTQAGQECGLVDAAYSRTSGLPIGVITADCVPVLLAKRDGTAVAAVHAGWKGTRALILRELWRQVGSHGDSPRDWVASIGPSIGPCCYQVSEELAEEFAREFSSLRLSRDEILPADRMLDLQAVNRAELVALGIGEIEILRLCTRCSLDADGAPSFNSYRREGSGTRQYSVIRVR